MTDISKLKAAARKAAFAARKPAHAQGLDEAANRNLLGQLALYRDARIISAYMPIRTEISPLAAMTILHGQGKRICVPVIQGQAQPLLFREWTPETLMVDGPFGAAVPAAGDFLQPDILVTPLLAFDEQCYRLGYGGGFYDRSFEQLGRRKNVIGLGFAYRAQQVAQVPRNETDHQLDAIVTESDVIMR
jgi:5-formyltetrahydrofolate cyclo-ligase